MTERLPTWHTQALERGIDYIVLVYEKAEGFVFCPSNLEQPFRVGGDYGGNLHTDAEGAIYHYERYVSDAFKPRIGWFMKYVKKVEQGIDFSLDALKLETRQVQLISGRWPW
jgi:hypothetical protein